MAAATSTEINKNQNHHYTDVNIAIVDSNKIQQLNSEFRHIDKPTNVLSFPCTPFPGEIETFLGDIAICASIVNDEALSQGKKTEAHWAHLTVHAILHLLGHDHENEADASKMENLEIHILRELGYNNPYND